MSKPLEEVKKLTIGQLAALVHAIGGLVAVKAILRDKGLAKRVAEFICNDEKGIVKVVGMFTAFVDYANPSYQELKSAFDWVDDWYDRAMFKTIDICKSVSREPCVVGFVYVHMDRTASSNEVYATMETRGLRPALYEELLAFAKAYPDEQRKFHIIALGSFCVGVSGGRYVAYLSDVGYGRRLRLDFFEHDWFDNCRFLAVSK